MALPRNLKSPPISEAMVDIRAAVNATPDVFDALAEELKADFPTKEQRQGFKAELKIEQGKLLMPTAGFGFEGVLLRNHTNTAVVQFRPDGFSFNNLQTYMGGDELLSNALRYWELFVSRFHPTEVQRLALRYTNLLRLPFQVGDEFSRFLTAAPPTPEGSPQSVIEFLSRVVAYDEATTAHVITTQKMTIPEPMGPPVIIIDVDAFREEAFGLDAASLRTVLDGLRLLKNRTFFSLLTEDAVDLYDK